MYIQDLQSIAYPNKDNCRSSRTRRPYAGAHPSAPLTASLRGGLGDVGAVGDGLEAELLQEGQRPLEVGGPEHAAWALGQLPLLGKHLQLSLVGEGRRGERKKKEEDIRRGGLPRNCWVVCGCLTNN